MKNLIKFLAPMAMVLFITISVNAQTPVNDKKSCDPKDCDITQCDPALCDLLVKAGICTKEQAAACKAKSAVIATNPGTTQVAAASMERVNTSPSTAKKTCAPASCAKACSGKKVNKEE